ncbi:MAG TPA: sulfurtransferase TusA family protein [Anaeromyxobacteraceae bacterium]|nr:sulfurtransferase TusA family protein [Anaeromyxobacteraceae bacterium]
MTRLDIRAYACPLTWVKTRIALERLRVGDSLEVLLAEGEPLENVPRSAVEEGHAVLSAEPAPAEGPGSWRLLLRKGKPREDDS